MNVKWITLCAVLASAGTCRAMGEADLLDGPVTKSSVIAVGRLDQFLAEPETLDRYVEGRFRAQPNAISGGNAEVGYFSGVQFRGTYVFHIQSTFKGHPPETLVVRLPKVYGYSSGFYLMTDLFSKAIDPEIPLKANYLLLLTGDAEHGFRPATLAPIPISRKALAPKESLDNLKSQDAVIAMQRYFVAQLDDPDVRHTAAMMLSRAQGPDTLKAMKPLADDKEMLVRSLALRCMAVNQDLDAIAKIAATGEALEALDSYKTPEAIPLLNQLVAEGKTSSIRNRAVLTLQELPPSKTSVPFLIKALRDKDQFVCRNSYDLLRRLVPEAKLPMYRDNPGEEQIKAAEKWWAQTVTKGVI